MLQRIKTFFCNLAWFTYSRLNGPSVSSWRSGIRTRQWKTLKTILRHNRKTDFGQRHAFTEIDSIRAYRENVPVTSYEDYQPAIDRIANGEKHVLTRNSVQKLEPTGGSTGSSKRIPYTEDLLRRFQQGIRPWVVNLFLTYPGLFRGKAYWAISPAQQQQEETPGGIPVGFDRDSEYLSSGMSSLIEQILAVPHDVKALSRMDSFRYVTLLFLLSCRELTLMSVWHPTFLTLLLDPLSSWEDRLIRDLQEGTIQRAPSGIPEPLRSKLEQQLQADPSRARELAFLFEGNYPDATRSDETNRRTLYERIWPELTVISCWADGPAERFVEDIRKRFPGVNLQPKGLVATEGILTVPIGDGQRKLPALDAHFLEFRDSSESDERSIRTVDELEEGQSYSVILTNGGGLYRYQLFDRVTVTDHYGACPVLQFDGKEDHVSDLFGEKLNAKYVEGAVQNAFSRLNGATPDFWFLSPVNENGQYAYALFVRLPESVPTDRLRAIRSSLEESLRTNYPYDYCRELKQLASVRIFRIDSSYGHCLKTFVSVNQQRGQNCGDVKPSPLHTYERWHQKFEGTFIR